jgi:hypothetical protein
MSLMIYKHRNCYCCVATISIAGSSVDSDALILFRGIMLSQGFRNQNLTTIYKQWIPDLLLLFAT